MHRIFALTALGATALAAPLAAQSPDRRLFVEGLVGAAVPTFDIADVATTGAAFGAAIGYRFDYGMHEDEPTGTVDISTLHLMAKVGYVLVPPRERGWDVIVNLGVGAVSFDVDGGDSYTYPAINAGAKIAYNFSRSLAVVLSPQGDIAFSSEDEVGASTSWVWPVTAGLRVNF